jgi:hypothetical protein
MAIQMFADAVTAGLHTRMVQLDGDGNGLDSPAVHRAAAHGLSGSGGSLPHLAAIQRAFGRHDVSSVQAHVGGVAAEGSQAMGARAYASGNQVAFAASPDLHLAAHEAAHVVQQRGGVQLSGGVGAAGDVYERHADAVADLVVTGQSAEAELDRFAGGATGGGSAGVQMNRRPESMSYAGRGSARRVTSAEQSFTLGQPRTLEALIGPLDDDLVGWMVMSGRPHGAPGPDRGPDLVRSSSNIRALWESTLRHAPDGPIEIRAELTRDEHGAVTFVRFSTPGFTHIEFDDDLVEAAPPVVVLPTIRLRRSTGGSSGGILEGTSAIVDTFNGGNGVADSAHSAAADRLDDGTIPAVETEIQARLEALRPEVLRLYHDDPTRPIYATISTHRSRVSGATYAESGMEVTAGVVLDRVELTREPRHVDRTRTDHEAAGAQSVVVFHYETRSEPITLTRSGSPLPLATPALTVPPSH